MTAITAGQCRLIDYLYAHKPGNVDVTLDDLMKAQEVQADEALSLITRGLLEVNRWTEDGPAYARLTHKGSSFAGCSVPWLVRLLSHEGSRPKPLDDLLYGCDRIQFQELVNGQDAGLAEAMTRDGMQQVNLAKFWDDDNPLRPRQVAVKLTARGQEYLAR